MLKLDKNSISNCYSIIKPSLIKKDPFKIPSSLMTKSPLIINSYKKFSLFINKLNHNKIKYSKSMIKPLLNSNLLLNSWPELLQELFKLIKPLSIKSSLMIKILFNNSLK